MSRVGVRKGLVVATLTAGIVVGAAGMGIASADPAPAVQCTPQARLAAIADSGPKVASFLATHPDMVSELAKIRSLPKDQRKAEWQSYRASHQQELMDFKSAHSAIHDYRMACHPHHH
ncbi:hemophore-related protein [Skermania sp. ID1734]|uniref:hemophore-related protein n=1 Tax=Skermania sp. ID1734 TaxID=2597516 RepID=UPI00163DBCC6|nr:hemophore-related protein [Skermania sp. ID1734]